MKVFLNEKFVTISGEVGIIPQGQLVSVIRLQGCNLRCSYCDAMDSQGLSLENGENLDSLVEWVNDNDLPLLITGGEPLLQIEIVEILVRRLSEHLPVQVETNGTMPVFGIPSNVCVVMDYKLDNPPDTENLMLLQSNDYLKFVVSSVAELNLTMSIINMFNADFKPTIAISATDKALYPEIIEEIKSRNRRVLVNTQIHKFIGVR